MTSPQSLHTSSATCRLSTVMERTSPGKPPLQWKWTQSPGVKSARCMERTSPRKPPSRQPNATSRCQVRAVRVHSWQFVHARWNSDRSTYTSSNDWTKNGKAKEGTQGICGNMNVDVMCIGCIKFTVAHFIIPDSVLRFHFWVVERLRRVPQKTVLDPQEWTVNAKRLD